MADRIVTDAAGREWTCAPQTAQGEDAAGPEGKDVVLRCHTPSVEEPVTLTVGWQWERMSENGLARMITLASPVPRR